MCTTFKIIRHTRFRMDNIYMKMDHHAKSIDVA